MIELGGELRPALAQSRRHRRLWRRRGAAAGGDARGRRAAAGREAPGAARPAWWAPTATQPARRRVRRNRRSRDPWPLQKGPPRSAGATPVGNADELRRAVSVGAVGVAAGAVRVCGRPAHRRRRVDGGVGHGGPGPWRGAVGRLPLGGPTQKRGPPKRASLLCCLLPVSWPVREHRCRRCRRFRRRRPPRQSS